MKVELQRYAKRDGNRETDRFSYVKWDIKVEEDRILIRTESNVYVANIK